MRKNAGLKSKEEMEQALRDGNVLFGKFGGKLYYDKKRIFDGEYPYILEHSGGGIEGIDGLWKFYGEMEIEIPWEDELKNRNILCWVSDSSSEDRSRIQLVKEFDGRIYKTLYVYGVEWKFATPITQEEAKEFVL